MAPRAMVLCAGLGTRLRPLTLELPKPLVPVGDRPLLAHIASRLSAAGFAELVINTHHLPESFSRLEQDLGLKAQVVHEPRIMGTAGGVYGARALFGRPPIVLWNGDIWVEPDLPGLCARAESGGLVLGVVPRPRGQGTVGLTAAGDVARLRGEVFGEEISGADYVGVAALGARCLDSLPREGCLIGDWALPELRRGGVISTLALAGEFNDAGEPTSYLELNLSWLRRHGVGAFVAESAEVTASVRVYESVIGAGARVSGEGLLRRVVVWPGARAVAPLEDAIVTRGHVVRLSHSA